MTEHTLTRATVRAVLSLTEDNVEADLQALLLYGDPQREIPPGALIRACIAFASEPKDDAR